MWDNPHISQVRALLPPHPSRVIHPTEIVLHPVSACGSPQEYWVASSQPTLGSQVWAAVHVACKIVSQILNVSAHPPLNWFIWSLLILATTSFFYTNFSLMIKD